MSENGQGRGNGGGRHPLPPSKDAQISPQGCRILTRSSGKDPLVAKAEEGEGPYWTHLRAAAATAVELAQEGNDPELTRLYDENLQYLGDAVRDESESEADVMIRLLADFLDYFIRAYRSGEVDARDAMLWMTDNRWNLRHAIAAFLGGPELGARDDEGPADEAEQTREQIVPLESRICKTLVSHRR